jgi:hypothetical protein
MREAEARLSRRCGGAAALGSAGRGSGMTPVEILTNAQALIRRGWCTRHYAKDATGTPVSTIDPDACRFCAVGALARASYSNRVDSEALALATAYLEGALPEGVASVQQFNDAQDDKRPVLALYSRAIKLAGGRASR